MVIGDFKAIAESTADVIDEMLELDGRASVAWRQAARALRAGDLERALELLGSVHELVQQAQAHAQAAAKGIFVATMAVRLEKMQPDKATGDDLELLINLTTPPPAKSGGGEN